MAKETQKAKIERLEQELKEKDEEIKGLNKLINEKMNLICKIQEQQDSNFENSGYKKQLEDKVFILETKLRQSKESQERAERKVKIKEKKVLELEEELSIRPINKLNERGAGRKERLSIAEKESIKMYRMQGRKMQEIAALYSCSVGLIHKIINEK